jgi:UDP-N-acetylglucosamine/UDP-N-acetylgalactosamine diphosphorylase
MFVFDALSEAKRTVVMEVDRNEEFAPVKNAEGEDSPQTARDLMARLYAKWLLEAGAVISLDPDGASPPIEISPLYALDADELKSKLPPRYRVSLPLYLGPEK